MDSVCSDLRRANGKQWNSTKQINKLTNIKQCHSRSRARFLPAAFRFHRFYDRRFSLAQRFWTLAFTSASVVFISVWKVLFPLFCHSPLAPSPSPSPIIFLFHILWLQEVRSASQYSAISFRMRVRRAQHSLIRCPPLFRFISISNYSFDSPSLFQRLSSAPGADLARPALLPFALTACRDDWSQCAERQSHVTRRRQHPFSDAHSYSQCFVR